LEDGGQISENSNLIKKGMMKRVGLDIPFGESKRPRRRRLSLGVSGGRLILTERALMDRELALRNDADFELD